MADRWNRNVHDFDDLEFWLVEAKRKDSKKPHRWGFRYYAALMRGPVNCTYFIRMGTTDAVKIGSALKGRQRLADHQISSPVDLELVAFVSAFKTDHMLPFERMAQKKAEELGKHIRGEWYALTDSQIEKIIDHMVDDRTDDIMSAALVNIKVDN